MNRYKIFVQVFLVCLFLVPMRAMELRRGGPATNILIAEALEALRGNGSRTVEAILQDINKKIDGTGRFGRRDMRAKNKPLYEELKAVLEKKMRGELSATAQIPPTPALHDDAARESVRKTLETLLAGKVERESAVAQQGGLWSLFGLQAAPVDAPERSSSVDGSPAAVPADPKTGQLILSTVAITVVVLLLLEWALRKEKSVIASWFRPAEQEQPQPLAQLELPSYEEALAIATELLTADVATDAGLVVQDGAMAEVDNSTH